MVFGEHAQKYWNVGLPVIPLIPNEKRPAINGWQLFADQLPSDADQSFWLTAHARGNIGLPLGPTSGLVALDIDTDDPKVLAALARSLPPSPWVRVGKKGMVKIFKFNREKTVRIKDADGNMICEILSKGTQIVLPPSIHPDTKRAYTANRELVDVFTAALPLPAGVEQIVRDALTAIGIQLTASSGGGIVNFVPAGARDNQMVWHAGLLARAVWRGERPLLQAMGELKEWIETYVEKVVGDPITVEKAHTKLIEFLARDVKKGKRLPVGWDEGLSEADKEKLGLSFTDEDEIWDYDRIAQFLTEEFIRLPDRRGRDWVKMVDLALARMGTSATGSALSPLEEGMVLKFIAAQSGGVIALADLKKQLTTNRRGDVIGDNQEEIAQAALIYLSAFGEVRFSNEQFWQWKGASWEGMPSAAILSMIASQFGDLPVSKRHSDYCGVMRVMQNLCSKKLSSTSQYGINFANGFLTGNLELVPHSPDHGMTYFLPFPYSPEKADDMPLFNRFLDDCWGNDQDYREKRAAFQEAVGATLMLAAPTYQKALCLFGQPGSGKSVATSVVSGLLPPNSVSSIPPDSWSDKFLPAEMLGKSMNNAGELSETRLIPGDAFKRIVTGEMISAQRKNQSPFNFEPRCAQWFTSNHLPKTRDSSDGFNRRWLFFEFGRRVAEKERVPDLHRLILEAECEAIVAWAVQGYDRLRKAKRYTEPASHKKLLERMASHNNSVRRFLSQSERVKVGRKQTNERTSATMLHSEYWTFAMLSGVRQRVEIGPFVAMMNELQDKFQFEERIQATGRGNGETIYDHIEIVG